MPLPRTEVTKKIWDYIKKNKLQDVDQQAPDQCRRQAASRCSAARGKVSMFEMTKLVSNHLK